MHKIFTEKEPRSGWAIRWCIFFALLGMAGLLLATRLGIGLSTDSAVYIGAARNLESGRGLTVPFGREIGAPLTIAPPLFSAMLAMIGFFGLDPLTGARWLNIFLSTPG